MLQAVAVLLQGEAEVPIPDHRKAESDADIFLLSSEKFFYRQVNPPEKRAFHPENLNPYVL